MTPLEARLDKIVEIEGKLPSSVFSILSAGSDLYVSDFFCWGQQNALFLNRMAFEQ